MFARKYTYDWTMIDIHNHMLFGVDDGSRNLEMSMEMLKIAREDGIWDIVITPHYSPKRGKAPYELIQRNFNTLQRKVAKEMPELSLYLGREVYYSSDTFEDVENVKDPETKKFEYEWGKEDDSKNDYRMKDLMGIRMCATRNILLEFSFITDFETIKRGVTDCFLAGFQPIVAHVERYACIAEKPMLIKELREMGAYIQINADSLFASGRTNTRRCAKKLIKNYLVDFVASDAHNLTSRVPVLSAARDYVTKHCSEEYSRNIFRENAKKIIIDKYIKNTI